MPPIQCKGAPPTMLQLHHKGAQLPYIHTREHSQQCSPPHYKGAWPPMLPHNPNQGSTANGAPPSLQGSPASRAPSHLLYKGAQPTVLPSQPNTREHSQRCSPASTREHSQLGSWCTTREHSPCVLPYTMHKGAQTAVLLHQKSAFGCAS